MAEKLSGWDDTIVALATAPGTSAIGVLRLSGPQAIDIVNALFPSKDLSIQPTHTLHVGLLELEGQPLDEVVVSLFKGPKSYTGEDVVEVSCHGSPFVQQQVIKACIVKGARLARPGEFTQRAFLNGKMDLTQAEAVADLITANSKASQRTALHNVKGGFSNILKQLREQLIQFSALIELELDFSQEDVEFADRTRLYELIHTAEGMTAELLDSFELGNVIKEGVSVAIIGKPNAGKSTLLNALLNENRAIVSDIAGTTRDTIEELLNINGVLFRLIDTAGIRQHTHDVIEAAGMERSLEKMKAADLVLYLFDSNAHSLEDIREIEDEFRSRHLRFLLVANKIDGLGLEQAKLKFADTSILLVSARDLVGINDLREAVYNATVYKPLDSEAVIVSNTRHQQALEKVHRSLGDIREGLGNHIPGDLLALDIRHCLYYISEITGDVSNEDVLDYVFSKFCIGK